MKRAAFPFLLLTACQAEPEKQAPEQPAAIESNAQRTVPETARAMETARIGPTAFQYDPSRLFLTEAAIGVPPDWEEEAPGLKLVGRDRAELLDKAECMYGESGQASLCTAGMEAGLAFAILDRPYEKISAEITDPPPEPIEVAGMDGLIWKIGAEGEGADHILLPLDGRTLIVVRQYRNSGNPDEDALAQAMNSLSVDRD